MLKEEDKIFKNLYNEFGWEIDSSIKRDDWKDTKNIISKGTVLLKIEKNKFLFPPNLFERSTKCIQTIHIE